MKLSSVTNSYAQSTLAGAPRFAGGVTYEGEGRFSRFHASTAGRSYGDVNGYASLNEAIDALTFLTVGAHLPAAGVFERRGRFYGREMKVDVVFASSGKPWSGGWKLEQFPADRAMLEGSLRGSLTRADALRAIVDGAQRIDVTKIPVA
jgi:hypothetical protein